MHAHSLGGICLPRSARTKTIYITKRNLLFVRALIRLEVTSVMSYSNAGIITLGVRALSLTHTMRRSSTPVMVRSVANVNPAINGHVSRTSTNLFGLTENATTDTAMKEPGQKKWTRPQVFESIPAEHARIVNISDTG